MKKTELTKQYKVLLIVSTILLIATICGIVLNVVLGEADNTPQIVTNGDDIPIDYSAVNKLIFNTKITDILSNEFFIVDKNHHIGNMLLDAMSKARIPTEKMLLFADYLQNLADFIKENGFSIKNGQFDLENNGNEKIMETINILIKNFFTDTNFTEIELGRFIYQFMFGNIGDAEYKDILSNLGEEDFTIIFANVISSYNIITDSIENGASQSQARSLQALIYSIGSNLVNMIDKLGLNDVEELFGINYDVEFDETALTENEYESLKNYFDTINGKIGNIIYILGNAMKNIDAYTFEMIFEYWQLEDKQTNEAKDKYIVLHINLANALKNAIEESFENFSITEINSKQSFIDKYTSFFVETQKIINIANDVENFDFEAYENKIRINLTTFTNKIYLLSEIDYKSIKNLSIEEYNNIYNDINVLWGMTDFNFETTLSIKLINLILRGTALESFLKGNRIAFSDILRDTLSSEQWEEYLDLYS